MKISDKLQGQLTRLQRTGAFSISTEAKKELKECIEMIGGRPLTNLSCGVCVRNAMWELSNYLKQVDERPKLQFKAVKDVEDLNIKELRDMAKAKGLDIKSRKRQDFIDALK